MKKETHRILPILGVCLLFFFNTNLFSQNPLVLNAPIKSEIIEGKPKYFIINLQENQTARIVAEQTGADVSLISYNPSGEKILEWGLPLGRVGSEEILIISESAGEYRVEVAPGNSHRNFGEFIIKLTEIRKTSEDDKIKNQAAADIIKLMPEATELARVDANSQRRKSLEMWQEILKYSKIKQDKFAEARALNAIANNFYNLGEYQKALDSYVEVLEDWRELKNRRFEMVAAGRIGHIWIETGEYEKAIPIYQEGLNISRQIGSRLGEADNILSIGTAYLFLGNPQKALPYFEQTLPLYAEFKIQGMEASNLNFLGRAYFDLGDYGTAIGYFQKALDIQKSINELEQQTNSLLNLGKSFLKIGDSEKAYDYFTQANSLADEVGNKRLLTDSNYFLAIIESERGNLDKAIENLEIGLKIIENTRGELRSTSLRTSYFATVQNFYELYTNLLVRRWERDRNSSDLERSFEMSELSRSRSLVDLLEESKVNFKQGVDAEMLKSERDLLDDLNSKYRDRERLLSRKSEQKQIDDISAKINDLEIELERTYLQIWRKYPRFSKLVRGEITRAGDIQKLLDKETVLLEYKLGRKRSFLWIVTKNSIDFYELPEREEIENAARRFYDITVSNKKENAEEIQILSVKLSKILLSNVEPKIKGKRLAIVAEGILQYLPFSALRDENNYLTDKNEIVMLPSASVLAQLREHKNSSFQNDKTIAIFADPVFDRQDSRIAKKSREKSKVQNPAFAKTLRDFNLDESLPRLLASRTEARNISGFVDKNNSSLQLGFNANLKNIENSDLSKYRILHFATHGLLNTLRPELSGLVFSLYNENGQSQDGFLSLNDIYNLDLSSDMVVLSACQTALGKDIRGEGLIGISRGFLYAGSQRIVASLWKVDDSATAEFMKLFYQNHLEKKMPASTALRQAKLEMKKIPRYKSPYYWSAFTLLGDWQ